MRSSSAVVTREGEGEAVLSCRSRTCAHFTPSRDTPRDEDRTYPPRQAKTARAGDPVSVRCNQR